MGMLKRIIRQTSSKLLSKLGAQRNQLDFSEPISPTTAKNLAQIRAADEHLMGAKRSHRSRSGKKSQQIPEVVLLAAKSNLPPVQFHHVHGPNAVLSKNKFVARRTQSFCQALVFSNRVILPKERVYIKVLDIAKGWSGTIRFGFTSVDPATLRYQMPKHACPDMTNQGHTWARALADEVVRRNSVIHFSYDTNGCIYYGINNQDCGIFCPNVNTSQHLWFIVDIYGLTAAVELIDPRIHNASSSELDLTRLDHDDESIPRGTLYKSTSAMNHLCDSISSSRTKKKRSRKSVARQAALMYEPWHPENLIMTSALDSRFDLQAQQAARAMLPNLSSIILPSAQQNIYSPMPSMVSNRAPVSNESREYYQVMPATSTTHQDESLSSTATATSARIPRSLAEISQVSSSTSSSALSSSACTSGSSRTDVAEIAHQLDNMHVSSTSDNNISKQLISLSSKSTRPAAAARRRNQQNNSIQTSTSSRRLVAAADSTTPSHIKPKIAHSGNVSQNSSAAKVKNNGSSPSSSSASIRPKARQSLKNSAPLTARENNDNSPAGKDCPICFERPINCVLYQCGHMCTCYECGVKQWRTQSRTCPICRTIIKDVIKTYMS